MELGKFYLHETILREYRFSPGSGLIRRYFQLLCFITASDWVDLVLIFVG